MRAAAACSDAPTAEDVPAWHHKAWAPYFNADEPIPTNVREDHDRKLTGPLAHQYDRAELEAEWRILRAIRRTQAAPGETP